MDLGTQKRITLIKFISERLSTEAPVISRMILEAYGVEVYEGKFESIFEFITYNVKDQADETLLNLENYLLSSEIKENKENRSRIWDRNELRVFFSHLSSQKVLVSAVSNLLEGIGINAFVAHESIAPTQDWLNEIRFALSTCDGMVAFMHPGFRDSDWCDNEIGWGLGRDIPILPLSFGTKPYGFLSHKQHQFLTSTEPQVIFHEIKSWIRGTLQFEDKYEGSLVKALCGSQNFINTLACVRAIDELESLSHENYEEIVKAAKMNDQIFKCSVGYHGPTADKYILNWSIKAKNRN
jgi:hypothetical protein